MTVIMVGGSVVPPIIVVLCPLVSVSGGSM